MKLDKSQTARDCPKTSPERERYRKPSLQLYGFVSELTSGGTGSRSERNPQGTCGNQAPNKQADGCPDDPLP